MVGMDSQVESGTSVCLSILRRARLEKGSGCLFVRRLIATASPLNPTIVERGGRWLSEVSPLVIRYTRRLASKMSKMIMMLPSITNAAWNPTRRAREAASWLAVCICPTPESELFSLVVRQRMTESSGSGPRQQYGHLMIATRELPGSRDGISHKLRSFASCKRFWSSAAVLHTALRMKSIHLPQCASAAPLAGEAKATVRVRRRT